MMTKAPAHSYGVLRLDPEFGSSGIWNPPDPASLVSGPMIDYDLLDLPNELVIRLKAWQQHFEKGFAPGSSDPNLREPPDEFWDLLHAEEKLLAHALYEAVGGRVQYFGDGGLRSVGKNEPDVTNEELQADCERRLADIQ